MDRALQMDVLTVIGMGAVAGIRSTLPTTALRFSLGDDFGRELPWPASLLSAPAGMKLLSVVALGELALDKAPHAPNRVATFPLIGRMLSGAMVGFLTARRRHRATLPLVCLGAAAAAAAAFASFRLRRATTHHLGLPNSLAGLIEDGVALGMSRSLAARL